MGLKVISMQKKDYLGVRFNNHKELGFSYLNHGSFKVAFSCKKNQYFISNDSFRNKSIKIFIEQEDVIHEFLLVFLNIQT